MKKRLEMSFKSTIPEQIFQAESYEPGLSIEEIKATYGLANVIKMASNENPLGASPMVIKTIQEHAGLAFRYPQSGAPRLRRVLGEFYDLPMEWITPGDGSDELIDLLIRVKARPGLDNIVAFEPCFSMYSLSANLCGLDFRQAHLNADFSLNLDTLMDLVDKNTALVFLTNPDNPSGRLTPLEEIKKFAKDLPPPALLVVDEAYVEFADSEEASLLPYAQELENVIILRTFSKLYGLAGLRLGFAVAPAWLTDLLMRVRMPFSINILAEEAGLAALQDKTFVAESLRVVREGRNFLKDELTLLKCITFPSEANFIMFMPPLHYPSAYGIFRELLQQGVIIRHLASYGLPGHLRVSIGSEQENKRFIQVLRKILNKGKENCEN